MRPGAVTGFVSGVLGLTLLDAFLSGPTAANAGGLMSATAGLITRVLDPSVPAIPDHISEPAAATPSAAPPALRLQDPRIPPTLTV